MGAARYQTFRRRIALKHLPVLSVCLINIQRLFQDLQNADETVETWLNHFDPESKAQSMTSKHHFSTPRKFRTVMSAHKVMAIVFWDSEGILLIDYLNMAAPLQEPTMLIYRVALK